MNNWTVELPNDKLVMFHDCRCKTEGGAIILIDRRDRVVKMFGPGFWVSVTPGGK